jgi:signal transduction histidine kinase
MPSLSKFQTKAQSLHERYGVLFAGIVIFAYYLWTALDLFMNPSARRDFTGYFFQFGSVVMLWGIVFLGTKVLEFKKRQKEEQERNQAIVQEYERRKMQLELLDEVSLLLNDTVNNPLAVISVSASTIRERFEPDAEILGFLDSIDGALTRVREVLANFKSHQTTKIVKSIGIASRKPPTQPQKVLSVDPKGNIRSA